MIGWAITLAVYLAIIIYGIYSVWDMHKYFKELKNETEN
jgi:hypothetical protein